MPAPAKISSPPLTSYYHCDRQYQRLSEALASPVAWIQAPPGYGKTTLVRAYLERFKGKSLWYQCDAGDNDASEFFQYLGLSAKKALPRRRKSLPVPGDGDETRLTVFSRHFFDQLFDFVGSPAILVFDDYQHIPVDSVLHQLLCDALLGAPQGISLVLLSRAEPPPAFARLLAARAMRFMNGADLSLAADEARAMLKWLSADMGIRVPERSADTIIRQSEGWAAGMALALGAVSETEGELKADSAYQHKILSQYFAGEVLADMTKEEQDFLLATAVLPVMTEPLVTEVTGGSHGVHILHRLLERKQFIGPVEGREGVSRYHALFRQFLLSQAEALLPAVQIQEIRQRGAQALSHTEYVKDAIDLYREIEDWQAIANIAVTLVPSWLASISGDHAEEWFTSLPEECESQSPWILFWRSTAKLSGDPSGAQDGLARSYKLFSRQSDRFGQFLAWAGYIEAAQFARSDYRVLDPWMLELESMLEQEPSYPSPDIAARVACAMFSALVMRGAESTPTGIWESRTFESAFTHGNINQRVQAACALLEYHLQTGEYADAEDMKHQLAEWLQDPNLKTLFRLRAVSCIARYCWLAGVPGDAFEWTRTGKEIAANSGIELLDFAFGCHEVAAALSLNDLQTAQQLLKQLSGELTRAKPLDQAFYYQLASWKAMLDADSIAAARFANLALGISSEKGSLFDEGLGWMSCVQASVAGGDLQEAEQQLFRVNSITEQNGSPLLQIMALAADAHRHLELGNDANAVQTAKTLFATMKAHNCLNYYGWQMTLMTRLCVYALNHDIEVDFVRSLIRCRDLSPEGRPQDLDNWPWPLRIYTLGRFSIVRDGQPLLFPGKAQKRPLELLKAILALGGREVSEEVLAEVLWPHVEGDVAHRSLSTNLHRLRKLIGSRAILIQEGRLTLNARHCWVDSWGFERLLAEANDLLLKERLDLAWPLSEKAMGLYQGAFLSKESHRTWMLRPRERLRNKYLTHIKSVAQYLCDRKQCQQAILVYHKGLEVDDLAEAFYRGLMKCHNCSGNRAESLVVYEQCRQILGRELGVTPSQETQALMQKIKKD